MLVRIGDFDVHSLSDGTFHLDGGAMFGVVPKVLWQQRMPADQMNRVELGLRSMLIRTGRRNVLVDAGVGDKLSPREVHIYGLDRTRHLVGSLAALGMTPHDIDIVIATHLHLDHAGGFTVRAGDRIVPAFPRARYVIRRGEWQDATHPTARNRASYLPDDFLPLHDANVIDFIEDDGDVLPGISVWRTGGHTMHHQVVRVDSGGRTAVFMADLMPTAAHVDEAWIMGYDLYPMDTLAAKMRWLKEAIAGEYVIFFEHDPAITAGIIRLEAGRKRVEPIDA
jgi:glyoxylase-like metal-dependent hydrolase (beta-lactamase superfamily II)